MCLFVALPVNLTSTTVSAGVNLVPASKLFVSFKCFFLGIFVIFVVAHASVTSVIVTYKRDGRLINDVRVCLFKVSKQMFLA